MELKASSEEEGGIQETSEKLSDISDEFNRDVKVEEDQNDSEYDPVGVPNDEEEHLDEGEAAGPNGEDCYDDDDDDDGDGAGDDSNEKRTESEDDTDSDWW
ncbi:hypothetical protein SRHO_G00309930 [Serrasalmus rhombeus]